MVTAMIMLRRITKLASTVKPINNRLLMQGALISTNNNNNNNNDNNSIAKTTTRLFSSNWTNAIAGNKTLFSTAAATFVEEAHDKEHKDVTLYQNDFAPDCQIVQAFLDYYDIPYKIVEVTPNEKEIKWSDHKDVPLLMVDGEQIVDSPGRKDIIDKLAKKIHLDLTARSAEEDSEEQEWRWWAAHYLASIQYINTHGTISEVRKSLEYVTSHGNFSFIDRVVAKYIYGTRRYFNAKQVKYACKRVCNVTDERAGLYKAVETWADTLNDRDFLGGTKPNLADLAVYGVLRPIRYRECGREVIEQSRICDWYSRMEIAVGVSSKIQA